MLIAIAAIILALIPVALYYARQVKTGTPSLHWPKLAGVLNMQYQPDPPRMTGEWNGRSITVELAPNGVRVAALLSKPSRLRIEIGPKAEVTRRAGMVVPDPVQTGDSAFDENYLARCNDKAAGAKIVDPVLRQRIMAQPSVDILGEGAAARWLLAEAQDPDILEGIFDVLSVIAQEMENFPQNA